jgi:hypothetical protein
MTEQGWYWVYLGRNWYMGYFDPKTNSVRARGAIYGVEAVKKFEGPLLPPDERITVLSD